MVQIMGEMIEIDIIILSFAQDAMLKTVTENAVSSLRESEPDSRIKFNIIIVESNRSLEPYQYPGTKTIYPRKKFGYHRYMNIGIDLTDSPYICICNNDLIFHKAWASELLKAFEEDKELKSASPYCSLHHPSQGIEVNSGNHIGYRVRKELVGWCIFFKREMLKTTGKLDPNYRFWYADDDYSMTLQKYGIKHALVSSSVVDHLESQTLKTKSEKEKRALTTREKFYYEYKWEGRSFLSYLNRLRKFK